MTGYSRALYGRGMTKQVNGTCRRPSLDWWLLGLLWVAMLMTAALLPPKLAIFPFLAYLVASVNAVDRRGPRQRRAITRAARRDAVSR